MQMRYRHFDTAKIYGSEPAALGNALTEAILDANFERDDIFVTSKLWGSDHLILTSGKGVLHSKFSPDWGGNQNSKMTFSGGLGLRC
ncbi:hypothetical protein Pyn_26191 [Prunus yedoensis var. nudiflora]|uniref:NADP-dependent oxidoreductase domain-containing protein n=1 Tax=Prunus yedoensis var. nudiflora TaxID=2094558 RepID=A0A314ZG04_PRUYE|nr:hypothetical protein Pyn_26191 [Prunus yedoensis var. nudiflora]